MVGRKVHGEVTSADASAGVAVTLYAPEGTVDTLAADEALVITEVSIKNVGAGAVFLTTGANSAGKRVIGGTLVANDKLWGQYCMGFPCLKATAPKLFAAAGQVDLQLVGVVVKVGA